MLRSNVYNRIKLNSSVNLTLTTILCTILLCNYDAIPNIALTQFSVLLEGNIC